MKTEKIEDLHQILAMMDGCTSNYYKNIKQFIYFQVTKNLPICFACFQARAGKNISEACARFQRVS